MSVLRWFLVRCLHCIGLLNGLVLFCCSEAEEDERSGGAQTGRGYRCGCRVAVKRGRGTGLGGRRGLHVLTEDERDPYRGCAELFPIDPILDPAMGQAYAVPANLANPGGALAEPSLHSTGAGANAGVNLMGNLTGGTVRDGRD
ncbi:hypothetical protein B0H17DRAFT_1154093, partial [Mycena rosella]